MLLIMQNAHKLLNLTTFALYFYTLSTRKGPFGPIRSTNEKSGYMFRINSFLSSTVTTPSLTTNKRDGMSMMAS